MVVNSRAGWGIQVFEGQAIWKCRYEYGIVHGAENNVHVLASWTYLLVFQFPFFCQLHLAGLYWCPGMSLQSFVENWYGLGFKASPQNLLSAWGFKFFEIVFLGCLFCSAIVLLACAATLCCFSLTTTFPKDLNRDPNLSACDLVQSLSASESCVQWWWWHVSTVFVLRWELLKTLRVNILCFPDIW